MRTSDAEVLLIPGLDGSGPGHWQTRWEAKLSTARTLDVGDITRPMRAQWVAAILAAAAAATKPVIFVAHSLGVVALAHASHLLSPEIVKGAMLVTPPSETGIAKLPQIDPAFAPYPRAPLPFPSILVASRNDPFAGYDESAGLALAWGSMLTDAGESGHINDASGHGPWPEGLMSFAGFLRKI